MYALEPEPEKRGRYQRFAVGGLVALGIGAAFIFGAQHIAPAQRLLSKVMPFSVVDEQPPRPKKVEPEEPPPPADLPKPKPKPQAAPTAAQPSVPPPPSTEPPKPAEPPGPESVGLDPDSFGSGSGGPSFHAGSTQMGVPTGGKGGGGGGGGTGEAEAPKVAPKIVEARPRSTNRQPSYPERARRLAIQGLSVIEADIDEQGKVTRAVVRQKLEPALDEEARKAVLGWSFEPATLQGKPVASTKFLRIRFQLE